MHINDDLYHSQEDSKIFTHRDDIVHWLNEYHIKNYSLVEDEYYTYTVDVWGPVNLWHKELEVIPVKFGHVTEEFWCNRNKIFNLEFAPHSVDNSFFCCHNQLTSLKGCPTHIKNNFSFSDNLVTTLQFIPQTVGGYVESHHNPINTFDIKDYDTLFKAHRREMLYHQLSLDLQESIYEKDKDIKKI